MHRATNGPGRALAGIALAWAGDLGRVELLELEPLVSAPGRTATSCDTLVAIGRPRQAAPEQGVDPLVDRPRGRGHQPAERLGGLLKYRVVQECQCLQRRVGNLAAGDADLAAGRIERRRHGERRGALGEGVQAAAIAVAPRADFPLEAAVGSLGRDARRLGREDARAAELAPRASRWRARPRRGSPPPRGGRAGRGPAAGSPGPSPATRGVARDDC